MAKQEKTPLIVRNAAYKKLNQVRAQEGIIKNIESDEINNPYSNLNASFFESANMSTDKDIDTNIDADNDGNIMNETNDAQVFTEADNPYHNIDLKYQLSSKQIHKIPLSDLIEADEPQWNNFFSSYNEVKLWELIFSILSKGLFFPILVKQLPDGKFLILAGHNRVRAFKRIIEEYGDIDGFNVEEYLSIDAKIFTDEDNLSDEDIKEIVVESNIQREPDLADKIKSIIARKDLIEARKDPKGRTFAKVAEDEGTSESTAYSIYSLTNLIQPLVDLCLQKKVSRVYMLKLSSITKDKQQYIYDHYFDKLNNKYLKQLTTQTTLNDFKEFFSQDINEEDEVVSVSTKMKRRYKEPFKTFANEWVETYSNCEEVDTIIVGVKIPTEIKETLAKMVEDYVISYQENNQTSSEVAISKY